MGRTCAPGQRQARSYATWAALWLGDSLTDVGAGWYNKEVARLPLPHQLRPGSGSASPVQGVPDAASRSTMQTILNQLGEMLLGSVPTVLFFLILLAAYAVLVRGPLEKVLRDRYARTGGAMDEAHAAIHAAEEKTAAYEARLREVRAELFAGRAARQKAASTARDRALAETRDASKQRVEAARQAVEESGVAARAELEAGAASLTQSVIAAILPHRGVSGAGVAQ